MPYRLKIERPLWLKATGQWAPGENQVTKYDTFIEAELQRVRRQKALGSSYTILLEEVEDA